MPVKQIYVGQHIRCLFPFDGEIYFIEMEMNVGVFFIWIQAQN